MGIRVEWLSLSLFKEKTLSNFDDFKDREEISSKTSPTDITWEGTLIVNLKYPKIYFKIY